MITLWCSCTGCPYIYHVLVGVSDDISVVLLYRVSVYISHTGGDP